MFAELVADMRKDPETFFHDWFCTVVHQQP